MNFTLHTKTIVAVQPDTPLRTWKCLSSTLTRLVSVEPLWTGISWYRLTFRQESEQLAPNFRFHQHNFSIGTFLTLLLLASRWLMCFDARWKENLIIVRLMSVNTFFSPLLSARRLYAKLSVGLFLSRTRRLYNFSFGFSFSSDCT